MQNTRRWHFAGDLYFDLALYIQQLTVPTVMLWGEQAHLPASSWDGGWGS